MGRWVAESQNSTQEISKSKAADAGIGARLLIAGLVLLVFPLVVSTQQISDQELRFDTQPYRPAASLHVQRNIVQVDVVVRDAKGQAVGGLQQQGFTVFDKGKQQTIAQFAVESAVAKMPASPSEAGAPSSPVSATSQLRFLALFFDDRDTPFSDLAYARQAAEKFVRENLHPGDEVGVFTASASTTLDFTADTQKLLQAIESVHLQTLGQPAAGCPGSPREFPLGPYAAYLIADENDVQARNLYLCGVDTPSTEAETEVLAKTILSSAEVVSKSSLASLRGVIEHLAQMPGHGIVVLSSSGFFSASLQQDVDVMTSEALAEGVVINSLDAKGLVARTPGGDAKDSPLNGFGGLPASEYEKELLKRQREEMDDVMVSLARDTGGIFFHNNNDLDLGLREMAEVPEVSYRLGFSPANLKPDGKFHDLKVKLTTPGSFEIQARHGYFAPTEAAQKSEAAVGRLDDEVMKTDEMNAIPAEVGARAGRLAAGGTGFQISLRVDPKFLSFQKDHGKHLDKLNLITALFNSEGKFITGEMGVVNMALTNKTLDDLSQRGINATVVLNASEGRYRLRVVLEDADSSKMFATTRPLSIP
ncbi:MAG TPA: VWA domain-containing protein [Candidatus Acidoferrales bacterium]|nr:VWA domain-containing protein [Candidatus Acidoferrales bacterium]